jgi:anti-sigma factor ChrR (cupin superfamily)
MQTFTCDFCHQPIASPDVLTTLDGTLHSGTGSVDTLHLDACPDCAPHLKPGLAQYMQAVAGAAAAARAAG